MSKKEMEFVINRMLEFEKVNRTLNELAINRTLKNLQVRLTFLELQHSFDDFILRSESDYQQTPSLSFLLV
jgi:hypothetical protein